MGDMFIHSSTIYKILESSRKITMGLYHSKALFNNQGAPKATTYNLHNKVIMYHEIYSSVACVLVNHDKAVQIL